jgi:aspartyl-tRNA(Asn)/glutamyl-tRNA(Gln) amidotransferase subunit A
MDSTTINLETQNFMPIGRQAKLKTQNLTIGIPKEYFEQGLDKEVKKQIEKVIEKLEKNKYKIKKISLPYSEYSLAVYYIIMPAEVSANLARYDGIKYGYSVGNKNLLDNYIETRAKGFGKEVRRRIILGTYVLSAGYRDAYYNKAQKVRSLIKKDFDKVFSSGIDIILTPTTPTTAFKFGEKQDPLAMYLSDVYTASVNLAGLPAISVPAGEVKNLPVGVQFIAFQFKDDLLLQFANDYENKYV